MALLNDQARYYMHQGKEEEADKLLRKVIVYANAHGLRDLSNDAFTIYRTMYLEKPELEKLADLYLNQYRGEYERVRSEDLPLYLRLQAYISEARGDSERARRYYDSASVQLSGNAYQRSAFHHRFGQFLLRIKDTTSAIHNLQLAYEAAARADYIPFMMSNARILDSVFYHRHKFDSAYYYIGLHTALAARWAAATEQNKLDRLHVQSEYELRKHEEEARLTLQYTAIALAIGISFVLLIIFNARKGAAVSSSRPQFPLLPFSL